MSLSVATGSMPDEETEEVQIERTSLDGNKSPKEEEEGRINELLKSSLSSDLTKSQPDSSLKLRPVAHPIAFEPTSSDRLSGRSQQISGEDSGRKEVANAPTWTLDNIHEWRPELWRPNAIHSSFFYRGDSCFQWHWLGNKDVAFPSLLLNWDSFKTLWQLACSVRTFKAANKSYKKAQDSMLQVQQILKENTEYNEGALQELRLQSRREPLFREELNLQCLEHIEQLKANEAQDVDLSLQLRKLESDYSTVVQAFEESQQNILPLLEDLFEQLGTLPGPDDLEEPIPVPLLESEPSNNSPDPSYWHENTWNNVQECDVPATKRSAISVSTHEVLRDDPEATWNNAWEDYAQEEWIESLRQYLDDAIREAHNAQTAFNNFRGDYQRQLLEYSIKHRSNVYFFKNGGEADELEDKFGAEWFKRCQIATRKLIQADKKVEDIARRLKEAELAVNMFEGEEYEEEGGHSGVRKELDTEDAQKFGQLVSHRKRKRIDDWLDTETVQKKRRTGYSCDRTDSSFSLSEHSGNVSDWRLAEGEQRRRIDDYVKRTQQIWFAFKADNVESVAPESPEVETASRD
jgi:hypothetical protein